MYGNIFYEHSIKCDLKIINVTTSNLTKPDAWVIKTKK